MNLFNKMIRTMLDRYPLLYSDTINLIRDNLVFIKFDLLINFYNNNNCLLFELTRF